MFSRKHASAAATAAATSVVSVDYCSCDGPACLLISLFVGWKAREVWGFRFAPAYHDGRPAELASSVWGSHLPACLRVTVCVSAWRTINECVFVCVCWPVFVIRGATRSCLVQFDGCASWDFFACMHLCMVCEETKWLHACWSCASLVLAHMHMPAVLYWWTINLITVQ